MNVTVNGQPRSVSSGLSVEGLVVMVAGASARRGFAVAVNGTVVPRSRWTDSPLADGDAVEVLSAAQGG